MVQTVLSEKEKISILKKEKMEIAKFKIGKRKKNKNFRNRKIKKSGFLSYTSVCVRVKDKKLVFLQMQML